MEGLIPLAYAGVILVLLGVFGGLGFFLGWLLSSPAEETEQEVHHFHTHAFLPQVVELKHQYPQAEPATADGKLSEEEVKAIAENSERVEAARRLLRKERLHDDFMEMTRNN